MMVLSYLFNVSSSALKLPQLPSITLFVCSNNTIICKLSAMRFEEPTKCWGMNYICPIMKFVGQRNVHKDTTEAIGKGYCCVNRHKLYYYGYQNHGKDQQEIKEATKYFTKALSKSKCPYVIEILNTISPSRNMATLVLVLMLTMVS